MGATTVILPFLLSGCLQFGVGTGPGSGSPGSFSYYSLSYFDDERSFCGTNEPSCFYQIQNSLGEPLSSDGWSLSNGVNDGKINNEWSPTDGTQAGTIIGDRSNLVYFSTHGVPETGQTMLCLRLCDGFTIGADSSVDTSAIPNAWFGPNWLILDACDAVQQNVGWEAKFGNDLHGLLGFDATVQGNPNSALGSNGLTVLTSDLNSYYTAYNAWYAAVGAADDIPYIGMLIPSANVSDVIEARGGENFGNDRDTSPQFFGTSSDSTGVALGTQSGLAVNGDSYNLIAEPVNESAWKQQYGNPSGTEISPNSNLHVFTSKFATVLHFLASGEVVAESPGSGTAGAIGEAQAYQYAVSWIASNGGLPSDAVLTFAGRINNPVPSHILPCSSGATPPCNIPAAALPSNSGTLLWEFIWRHRSNGILWGDKIQIDVDDAGMWTVMQQPCNGRVGIPPFCITPPWIPSAHVAEYVRIWRSLGSVSSHHALIALPATMLLSGTSYTKALTGLCAPDAGTTDMVAAPCQEYSAPGGKVRVYRSLITGKTLGSN